MRLHYDPALIEALGIPEDEATIEVPDEVAEDPRRLYAWSLDQMQQIALSVQRDYFAERGRVPTQEEQREYLERMTPFMEWAIAVVTGEKR